MEILVRPILTEKMTKLGEKLNRYAFMVDKRADKLQIKELKRCMMSRLTPYTPCVILAS